jgi:hypothetical protein
MDTTTTPAPGAKATASEIIGLLYTLGVAAATVFVKNPAHVQTAQNIIAILNAELPNIESLL